MGAGALAAYLAVRWLQSPARTGLDLPQQEHSSAAAGCSDGSSSSSMRPPADFGDTSAAAAPHDLLGGGPSMVAAHSGLGVGPLGPMESTLGSGVTLSTAEILQAAAMQPLASSALACAAGGGSTRGSYSARPGVLDAAEARIARLGGGTAVCAGSAHERPAWPSFTLLWRMTARILSRTSGT